MAITALRQFCIPLLIVALCTQSACSTNRTKKFEAALDAGRCEDALENIPEEGGTLRFIGKANQTAGTALSYVATGAGYTADVAVTIVGGSIILISLCAPLYLATTTGATHSGPLCFPTPSGIKLPTMGAAVYRDTTELRCPDLTSLSKSMRRVAACEERKEQIIALERAKQTLVTIEGNADFMTCVSTDEKKAVHTDLARLREKIERVPATLTNEASVRN